MSNKYFRALESKVSDCGLDLSSIHFNDKSLQYSCSVDWSVILSSYRTGQENTEEVRAGKMALPTQLADFAGICQLES